MILEECLPQLVLGVYDLLGTEGVGCPPRGFGMDGVIELDGEGTHEGGGGRDGADDSVPGRFGF